VDPFLFEAGVGSSRKVAGIAVVNVKRGTALENPILEK
jgi:hypothetical protein